MDICNLSDVLFAMCEEQAEKLRLTQEEFDDRVEPKLQSAFDAMEECFSDFFRKTGIANEEEEEEPKKRLDPAAREILREVEQEMQT